MKQIIYSLTLALFFTSGTAFSETNSSSADSPLKIWTLGFPDFSRQIIMDKIAHKYGFEFELVGDCQVTREIVNKVTEHNTEVKAALAKKYGQGYWEKFEKEVADIIGKRLAAEKMVRQQPYVIAKVNELEFQNRALELITEEKGNDSFIIKVVSWEFVDGTQKMILHYIYQVNIKTNVIEQVESKGMEI